MKRVYFVLLCLLLIGAPLSAQNRSRSTYWHQKQTLFESHPTSPEDIVMLGNSITDGGEWAEILDNVHVRNRGISGDTTDGVLQRLGSITDGRPAKLFLMIGINDFAQGISGDSIARNIEQIICRIKAESPETEVYVQSILPISDEITLFPGHKAHMSQVAPTNAMIRAICERQGVTYVDLYSSFVTPDGKLDLKYSNDGLHLLGEGYKLWGSIIRLLI
ncbi:MAG: GDSL-type esterase/lipase family protein [Porphyromonas sp.]|uniref:GDSL-type esterase/lipase family protein n=1 Tax=Porphyromonas sp. TaxID=1924944 RepID=UPI002A90D6D5|nr:GDSL-type esterase/lipase family protein [Porphyromonas sp.]MDD7469133.1 GDSL-type esterase/lipase family protein [Bacteroidales bacterium]MDY6101597.1 GDSL-type esterase/lipase family protein [Porphyromonas sp.]